jgi:hypothetical protein
MDGPVMMKVMGYEGRRCRRKRETPIVFGLGLVKSGQVRFETLTVPLPSVPMGVRVLYSFECIVPV